jgi:cysteine-rich repeat protein
MTTFHRILPYRLRLALGVSCLLALLGHPQPSPAQICVGDCDGDGRVLVHELILGVNILLGDRPVSACPALADDHDMVTVSQLMQGINNSLGECAATPTPTPTSTQQPSTPSATPSLTATPATPTRTATVTAPPPTSTSTGTVPVPATVTVTATVTAPNTGTPSVTPTAVVAGCGNGVVDVDLGETCDDGNTVDGDACPATCRIATCDGAAQGTVTVQVQFATMPNDLKVDSLTLFLRYPESRVTIPGSGSDPAVQARVSSPLGFGVAADDLDYALRAVLEAPSQDGVGAGSALAVQFDICAGEAVPVARNFTCGVEAASTHDAQGNPISVSGSVTCTVVVQPPVLPLVCGDGIVNLAGGETCDDGNTLDGDSCPSTCRIEPCAGPSQGRVAVQAKIAGMPSNLAVAGLTLLLDYPEGRISLPGSSDDPTVIERVTSPAGFSVTPNDLDYALRAVLVDPLLNGISGGTALSADFDICAGEAVPVARNFTCTVVDATGVDDQGTLFNVTGQVTCTVVVQPPVLPEVCGDGIVNLAAGETCDDGNTLDGDSCPSTCHVEPCAGPSQGRVAVQTKIAGMPSTLAVAGLTLLLDYPEERISLPGSSDDPTVIERVTSPAGFSFTPNDLDYALRAVLVDPLLNGISGGTALSADFDICAGEAVPVARNFTCTVVDATGVDDQGTLFNVTGQVTCTVVVQPPVLPEVCGDGIVNLASGETCDDGNTLDGDSCPSTCHVDPCQLPGSQTATAMVTFSTTPPELLSGMTLLVDYPEGAVGIQGSSDDAAVQSHVMSTSFSVTPNDLDYALRAVLIDPTLAGLSGGTALTIQFDVCTGAALPAADAFSCTVVDAATVDLASPTSQVSCSVALQ